MRPTQPQVPLPEGAGHGGAAQPRAAAARPDGADGGGHWRRRGSVCSRCRDGAAGRGAGGGGCRGAGVGCAAESGDGARQALVVAGGCGALGWGACGCWAGRRAWRLLGLLALPCPCGSRAHSCRCCAANQQSPCTQLCKQTWHSQSMSAAWAPHNPCLLHACLQAGLATEAGMLRPLMHLLNTGLSQAPRPLVPVHAGRPGGRWRRGDEAAARGRLRGRRQPGSRR